jgi:hypothetical protein
MRPAAPGALARRRQWEKAVGQQSVLPSTHCASVACPGHPRMIRTPHRLALFVAAAIPFVLLPATLAWSVGPLARMGARWCNLALDSVSFGAEIGDAVATTDENALPAPPFEEPTKLRDESPAVAPPGARPSSRRPSAVSEPGMTASTRPGPRRARPNVFVGPESIQRAIPVGGRPTSAWTSRTLQHPAGLLIQSPGALTGVIEAGDILVEAEGQPLNSFEQLVVTVKQAYERRATRLSGRLFRKGDLVPVTVEPGW